MRLHFCELAPHARNSPSTRFALSEPCSVFHMVYRAFRSGAIFGFTSIEIGVCDARVAFVAKNPGMPVGSLPAEVSIDR